MSVNKEIWKGQREMGSYGKGKDIQREELGNQSGQAEWQALQYKAFLRWTNHGLAKRGLKAENLEDGLEDGLLLHALLEVLSEKTIRGVRQRVPYRVQKINNHYILFEFMKKEEVHLENMGPEDIVDKSTKLILGLIWTLILRYQIGRFMTAPTPSSGSIRRGGAAAGGAANSSGGGKAPRQTMEQQLLGILDGWLGGYNIPKANSLADALANGKTLAAMIHSLDPSAIDPATLPDGDHLGNIQKAFNILESPPYCAPLLLDPVDLANKNSDNKANMALLTGLLDALNDVRKNPERLAAARANSPSTSAAPSAEDALLDDLVGSLSATNENTAPGATRGRDGARGRGNAGGRGGPGSSGGSAPTGGDGLDDLINGLAGGRGAAGGRDGARGRGNAGGRDGAGGRGAAGGRGGPGSSGGSAPTGGAGRRGGEPDGLEDLIGELVAPMGGKQGSTPRRLAASGGDELDDLDDVIELLEGPRNVSAAGKPEALPRAGPAARKAIKDYPDALRSFARGMGGINEDAPTKDDAIRRFDVDGFVAMLVRTVGRPVFVIVQELEADEHPEPAEVIRCRLVDLLESAKLLRAAVRDPDATVSRISVAKSAVVGKIPPLLQALRAAEDYLLGISNSPEISAAPPFGNSNNNSGAGPSSAGQGGQGVSSIPGADALASALENPEMLRQNFMPLFKQLMGVLQQAEQAVDEVSDPQLRRRLMNCVDEFKNALMAMGNEVKSNNGTVSDPKRQRVVSVLQLLLQLLNQALSNRQAEEEEEAAAAAASKEDGDDDAPPSFAKSIARALQNPVALKQNFAMIVEQLKRVREIFNEAIKDVNNPSLRGQMDRASEAYRLIFIKFVKEYQSTGTVSQPTIEELCYTVSMLERLLLKAQEAAKLFCSVCNKGIEDQYVTIDNSNYHPECFSCAQCKSPLRSYVSFGGKFYCSDHVPASAGVNKTCTGCGKALSGQYLEAIGGSYHPECLVCSRCSGPVGTSFYTVGNAAVCSSCVNK